MSDHRTHHKTHNKALSCALLSSSRKYLQRVTAVFLCMIAGLIVGCKAKEAPPLKAPQVGTIIGEVWIENPGLLSVGDAIVEVYGTSAKVTTEAGKQFVLGSIPMGTHTLSITHADTGTVKQFDIKLSSSFQTLYLSQEQTTLVDAATLSGKVEAGDEDAGVMVYLVGGNSSQIVFSGDDGSYVLNSLPTGDTQIAYYRLGMGVQIVPLTLVSGPNTTAPINLSPLTAIGEFKLKGVVKLTDTRDYQGTVVSLNNGDAITTTNNKGEYKFSALTAGSYSLKASRDGYKSVEIAAVTIDNEGEVHGIVNLSVAPGSDLQGGDVTTVNVINGDQPVVVTINSHQPNDTVLATVPTVFSVNIEKPSNLVVTKNDIVWSWLEFGSLEPAQELGTGGSIIHIFPAFGDTKVIDLIVDITISGELLSKKVTLFLEPLVPQVKAVLGITPLTETRVLKADGTIDHFTYTMIFGQPATVQAIVESNTPATFEWSSTNGFFASGPTADFSTLSIGTHNIILKVIGSGGQSGATQLVVNVDPFIWTPTILQPALGTTDPTYLVSGLPLEVSPNHPYQLDRTAFTATWSSDAYGPLAQGLNTRTYELPSGTGVVRLLLSDAYGHQVATTAQYLLQTIDFTANFTAPGPAFNKLEGSPVTVAAAYSHSLVPSIIGEDALSVNYFSSIQGLLVDDTGESAFLVTDQPTFTNLVAGTHMLIVRIGDGRIFAEGTRQITLRGAGVSATMQTPIREPTVYFQPNDTVQFETIVAADSAALLHYSWYIDGQEFLSTWGGYGSDPTAASRKSINLGAFNQAIIAPFSDIGSPWNMAGDHVIEFFVRLASQDSDPAQGPLGCIDVPGKSVCLRRTIQLAPAAADICTADGVAEVITTPTTWSGLKKLNCNIKVEGAGASLTILPGTHILVTGFYSLSVERGDLIIGDATSSNHVIFETSNPLGGTNKWQGIVLGQGSSSTGELTLTVNNTVLKNTRTGIFADYTYGFKPASRIELRNLTIDTSVNGLWDFCPEVADNITITNTSNIAFEAKSAHHCNQPLSYNNWTVDTAKYGVRYANMGFDLELNNFILRHISRQAIQSYWGIVPTRVTVKNSTIENTGREGSGYAALSTSTVNDRACAPLTITGNTFINNFRAIESRSCTTPAQGASERLTVLGNIFKNNDTAIYDDNRTTLAAEVHLNTFTGNTVNIELRNPEGADFHAQGNYFGGWNDSLTTAGSGQSLPAGILGNLPAISDWFDNNNNERFVRSDNPLRNAWTQFGDQPVAYIDAPIRTRTYNSNRCIPLIAKAPLVIPASLQDTTLAACTWWLDGDQTTGAQVFADTDSCLDTAQSAITEGTHSITLVCDKLDALGAVIRTDSTTTLFKIDNSRYMGRQYRASETWTGTVLLGGDITIPTGHTLNIESGTVVQFEANDDLFLERYPYHGSTTLNRPNQYFGSRALIDIYVEPSAHLFITGTAQSKIRLEPQSGIATEKSWGNINVYAGGDLTASFAEFVGARYAIHGEYIHDNPFMPPVININDSLIDHSVVALRGACPKSFDRNTVTNTGYLGSRLKAFESFSINGGNFTGIGSASPTTNRRFLYIEDYDSGVGTLSVQLNNVTLHGGSGRHTGGEAVVVMGSTFSSLVIDGGSYKYARNLFRLDGTAALGTINITNITADNFGWLYESPLSVAALNIDNSTFNNGDYLLWAGNVSAPAISITNNWISNITKPIHMQEIGGKVNSLGGLVITGNHFETVDTVFSLNATANGNNTVDLSGNSYINIATLVLDLDEQNLTGCTNLASTDPATTRPYCSNWPNTSGRSIEIDMTNNFFGTTTAAGFVGTVTALGQADVDLLLGIDPVIPIPAAIARTILATTPLLTTESTYTGPLLP